MIKSFLNELVKKLDPPRCLSCRLPGSFICETCSTYTPYLEQPLCPVCTRPAVAGFTHPRCRSRYCLDRLFVPFRYRGVIAVAIKKLKYKEVTTLADFLANLIVEEMTEEGFQFGSQSIIIPVPLHRLKLLERGYNQAGLLGNSLGKRLGIRVVTGVLKRIRETPTQTKLKGKEREKNVKNAFAVDLKKVDSIFGKDILLVDDVFTTGATLRECGRILKHSGARYIYAVTVAKD